MYQARLSIFNHNVVYPCQHRWRYVYHNVYIIMKNVFVSIYVPMLSKWSCMPGPRRVKEHHARLACLGPCHTLQLAMGDLTQYWQAHELGDSGSLMLWRPINIRIIDNNAVDVIARISLICLLRINTWNIIAWSPKKVTFVRKSPVAFLLRWL